MSLQTPTAPDKDDGLVLVSWGSGNGSRVAEARGKGRNSGRRKASPTTVRRLRRDTARAASTPGRGKRQREALAGSVNSASANKKLTNKQVKDLRDRLKALNARMAAARR